jgi:hypothetical protein
MANPVEIGAIGELQRVFNLANLRLFEEKIPSVEFLWNPEKKLVFGLAKVPSVVIIGGHFAKLATPDEALEELLHLMIHLYHRAKEVRDFSANAYHNKLFLERAIRCGFFVGYHKSRGWDLTRFSLKGMPSQKKIRSEPDAVKKMKAFLEELDLKVVPLLAAVKYMQNHAKLDGPPKKCFLKYVCKCSPPHNSIRSGRRPDGRFPLRVKCLTCKSEFQCVEN